MRRPAEFAGIVERKNAPGAWRGARQWLGLTAVPVSMLPPDSAAMPGPVAEPTAVRFGFTVGKRQARRAVDRNMVKRVLREAVRQQRAVLEPLAAARAPQGQRVVLRLKAALPARRELARAELRATLRREADSLLAQLARVWAQPQPS